VITGFIYGPLAAFIVTVIVSFAQMITGVSQTAHIGLLMNIIASTAFCCTAALIYKRKRTFNGALLGLIIGGIVATAVMMMWNYIITPLFLNITREQVVVLLLPGFLPFNLISNGLNIVFSILLYKRIKVVLKAARMMPKIEDADGEGQSHMGIILSATFVVATILLWVLIIFGVI